MTHALYRFCKLMCVAMMCAHWMSCLFFAIAYTNEFTYNSSWLAANHLLDASIGEQYVNAMYWCITTMATVGYGDINPQSTIERLVVIVIMIVAAGVYAYIINDVGHIVNNFNMLAA